MKLLLDTHAALWWLSDDELMGREAARQLTDQRNQVLLSAAVVWEVAIKRSLGRLQSPPPQELVATLIAAGAQPVPVTHAHAIVVESLPRHHRDPFDRMLVAQALGQGASLVSGDEVLRAYEAPVIW